jgi:folylpolyglutamate synthase/dihydropteroate synthase
LNGDAARDYAQVQEDLFALKARGVSFGIDRMRSFAAELSNPERAVPVIHIAGTNGKGSVAAMVAAILRAAGHRTGLYTSPHLVRLGERVQVDGVALTELVDVVEGLEETDDVVVVRELRRHRLRHLSGHPGHHHGCRHVTPPSSSARTVTERCTRFRRRRRLR